MEYFFFVFITYIINCIFLFCSHINYSYSRFRYYGYSNREQLFGKKKKKKKKEIKPYLIPPQTKIKHLGRVQL